MIPFFDVEQPEGAVGYLVSARALIWILTSGILLMTYKLGRLLRGPPLGLVSALLLSNCFLFFVKSMEIRPDVPSTLLLVSAVVVATKAIQAFDQDPNQSLKWRWIVSGVFLGVAILCTQKVLFAIPGFFAASLTHLATVPPARRSRAWTDAGWAFVGMSAPIGVALAYFAWLGGALQFVEHNLLMNLRWQARLSPWGVLSELFLQNPGFSMLAVIGLFVTGLQWIQKSARQRGEHLYWWVGVSAFAGTFIIPVPHRHYALMFLPFAAILAAQALTAIVGAASAEKGARLRTWLTASALILLSLYPSRHRLPYHQDTISPYFRSVEYVLSNTGKSDTVMDGFSGFGVFRHHAYFRFFLHNEIRAMMEPAEWVDLEQRLVQGDIAPKLVIYDRHLREVPKGIRDFLESNYRALEHQPIRAWLPRDHDPRWSDLSRRHLVEAGAVPAAKLAPYLLVEQGFHPPSFDGTRAVRRSRGRRSLLQIPLQKPQPMEAVFKAKSVFEHRPLRMSLAVNGREVGDTELREGWSEYRFTIEKEWLDPGFNEFLLTYSTTPYREDPSKRGTNSVIALEYLELAERR